MARRADEVVASATYAARRDAAHERAPANSSQRTRLATRSWKGVVLVKTSTGVDVTGRGTAR